jgi:dTDP-4-dehydrorhamnose reductase
MVRGVSEMRVVVTGASGQLGSYLIAALAGAGHVACAWSGNQAGQRGGVALEPVDLADPAATQRALERADPEVVVHAAAVSTVEAVWRDPAHAWRVNVDATCALAQWCRRRGCRLILTSTDLVFDGLRGWYREDDPAEPLLAYGRSKREAERAVLEIPGGVVARLSLLYGPSRCGKPTYFDRMLQAMREGQPQPFFSDEFRTPIHLATAARALERLACMAWSGLLHVAGRQRLSRHELMQRAAQALGIDPALAVPNRRADVPLPEPRPADVSLDTSRLAALLPDLPRPDVEEALAPFGGFDGTAP